MLVGNVCSCRLATQNYGVGRREEREERLFLVLPAFHIGNKHIGHSRITLQGSIALGLGVYAGHTSKDNSSKGGSAHVALG